MEKKTIIDKFNDYVIDQDDDSLYESCDDSRDDDIIEEVNLPQKPQTLIGNILTRSSCNIGT